MREVLSEEDIHLLEMRVNGQGQALSSRQRNWEGKIQSGARMDLAPEKALKVGEGERKADVGSQWGEEASCQKGGGREGVSSPVLLQLEE